MVARAGGTFQDYRFGILGGRECCYLVGMSLLLRFAPRTRRFFVSMVAMVCMVLLGSVAGCGGSSPEPEPAGGEVTAGSETTPGSSSETTLAETLELPSTTLIPVPSSGVPRHQLSAELRDIWSRVEAASAMVPPEYTGELTSEAITPWLNETFMPWATERGAASVAVSEASVSIPQGSPEFGVAGALVGYTYEEFVIAFRGAPVPAELAADPELLQVYLEALTSASEPMARQAAGAYGACARTLAPLGPDSPWVEWAQYCLYRAQEVNEVYRLEE